MTTGITYGLSLVDHPMWTEARVELCLTVATMDDVWMYALGEIAERLRGHSPFVYGSTVDVGASIDPEAGLSAFVCFAPSVLDPADYEAVELAERDVVTIVGLYPIHESERRFIDGHGLEEFWRLGWDMHDVHRGAVV